MTCSFGPEVGGQAVLGRQNILPTPWLTERHGYDPTSAVVGQPVRPTRCVFGRLPFPSRTTPSQDDLFFWSRSSIVSSDLTIAHDDGRTPIVRPFVRRPVEGLRSLCVEVGRPSGLRKTKHSTNSLAHRTTWLHPTFQAFNRFQRPHDCSRWWSNAHRASLRPASRGRAPFAVCRSRKAKRS